MKCLLLVALMLASFPVWASRSPYECRLYYGDESDVPSEAREIISHWKEGGAAARVCLWPGHPSAYWALTPVFRSALGICQYEERRIFKVTQAGRAPEWTYTSPDDQILNDHNPSRISMAVPTDACPRPGDPRFVMTDRVTGGTFLVLLRFWERISSVAGLEAELAHPASDFLPNRNWGLFKAIRSGEALRLHTVRFWDNVSPGPGQIGSPAFGLEIDGERGDWVLNVDFIGGELRLLGVGEFR